ncbi:MAG: NYN domain-containing protein [Oscillospiraceae bacterium]|nr:NYN domain-containing protein [Oscillospiraceae bacterium]
MNEEKKLALLIDSDNVSAKYAQFILQEASKYGDLTYKRVYGDWEKNNTGWRIPAMNNSILAVQQNSYIAGKNATDFSMIIDAMDIMYTGNVDGFVLVTSDSDFTRLAVRLREAGKLVVGIGEVKTPIAFTSSCHHFSYLNQVCDNLGDYNEKTLRKAILDYVKENDDGKLDLVKINAYLTSCYGTIDYAALGYNRLSMFIDSFSELRRNSNFVTLKRKTPGGKASVSAAQPTANEIAAVIVEYLKRQRDQHDDLSKVDEYVTKIFGKVDFGGFGSKRFARFIDKRSEFIRHGNDVILASGANGTTGSSENEPPKEPAANTEVGKTEAPTAHTMRITPQVFTMEVRKYASDNMPNGGNLGQLNNLLLEKYGKSYVSELGFADFAAAISSVEGVFVSKNFIKNADPDKPDKTDKRDKTDKAVKEAEKPVKEAEKFDDKAAGSDAPEPELTNDEDTVQKPEINSIKRDVFAFAARSGNNAPLPALGSFLTKKYGRGYLKELGFTTMKKLIASINGVSEKNNVLSLDEDFIKRTEEIEQFVFDFARGEGSRSIKSLSGKIKKQFGGFDFTDYGYSKFSDFINAIDGVRANGYYVEADD